MSAELVYDSAENIIFMTFPTAVHLDTRDEIASHFDRVIAFWRANARGRKCYYVVDFDNVHINPAELDFYAEQSKRAHDLTTIASVRYGGTAIQRTVTRLAGMKIHRPSNIYATRAEALSVVRKLKAGDVSAKP